MDNWWFLKKAMPTVSRQQDDRSHNNVIVRISIMGLRGMVFVLCIFCIFELGTIAAYKMVAATILPYFFGFSVLALNLFIVAARLPSC